MQSVPEKIKIWASEQWGCFLSFGRSLNIMGGGNTLLTQKAPKSQGRVCFYKKLPTLKWNIELFPHDSVIFSFKSFPCVALFSPGSFIDWPFNDFSYFFLSWQSYVEIVHLSYKQTVRQLRLQSAFHYVFLSYGRLGCMSAMFFSRLANFTYWMEKKRAVRRNDDVLCVIPLYTAGWNVGRGPTARGRLLILFWEGSYVSKASTDGPVFEKKFDYTLQCSGAHITVPLHTSTSRNSLGQKPYK